MYEKVLLKKKKKKSRLEGTSGNLPIWPFVENKALD